jgi:hypothetical protein
MKARPARSYSETELLYLSAGYPIRSALATGSPRFEPISVRRGAAWRFVKRLLERHLAARGRPWRARRKLGKVASSGVGPLP